MGFITAIYHSLVTVITWGGHNLVQFPNLGAWAKWESSKGHFPRLWPDQQIAFDIHPLGGSTTSQSYWPPKFL